MLERDISNFTVEQLVSYRDKLKLICDAVDAELGKTINKLQADCHHPREHVVHREEYSSGSYYDRAYTMHYYTCKVCGKTIQTESETHPWYG